MALLLGFDIGGTKIGIGLGDSTGKLLGTTRRDNRNTDPAEVLPWMVKEAKRLVSEAGLTLEDVDAFGISAPFPADAARGIMTKPTNNPLWRDVPILDYLKKSLPFRDVLKTMPTAAHWQSGFSERAEAVRILSTSR